jgi:hypothetical protein
VDTGGIQALWISICIHSVLPIRRAAARIPRQLHSSNDGKTPVLRSEVSNIKYVLFKTTPGPLSLPTPCRPMAMSCLSNFDCTSSWRSLSNFKPVKTQRSQNPVASTASSLPSIGSACKCCSSSRCCTIPTHVPRPCRQQSLLCSLRTPRPWHMSQSLLSSAFFSRPQAVAQRTSTAGYYDTHLRETREVDDVVFLRPGSL